MLSVCIGLVDKITHHLQFSREYQNIGVHEPFWQSLREMTEKAVSDIHHENVDIIVDIGDVEIYADPLSIKVIYNLLENAIRHATCLTWIRVHSAEKNDGTYVVSIEDNGPGISQKEKEKIFDQGYGKNTGFGLTLSRDILAVTGISIIENGEEGKGARFEVTIPIESWRYLALES